VISLSQYRDCSGTVHPHRTEVGRGTDSYMFRKQCTRIWSSFTIVIHHFLDQCREKSCQDETTGAAELAGCVGRANNSPGWRRSCTYTGDTD
jgi:hypothetical protein